MKNYLQKVLLGIGVSWLIAGCEAPSSSSGLSRVQALVPPPSSAAVDYAVSSTASPKALAEAAIQHHPSILAARHRAKRLAERVPQQRALPDPTVELSAGQMAETAAGQMVAGGSVKQRIPFPGKLSAQAAAAASEAAAALVDVEAMELRLTEQVHAAWWDYFLAEKALEITRESRDLLNSVRESVDARVAANQAGQGDQLRVLNELSLIDRDLSDARKLKEIARAKLNSLLNRPLRATLPKARLTPVPSTDSLESLLARAEQYHPEVGAAEKRVSAFRHKLKRAQLEKYPDFTAGIGGASISDSGLSSAANGRDQVFASFGFTIPLWQEPRKAMIREAREGIEETEAMVESIRSDLRYRVGEAWFRAKSSREIIQLFKTRLIPDSKQAYEVTLTEYAAGTGDFTGLLESMRLHLSYRLQLSRNQAMLGKAAATVRAAAGVR